MKAKLNQAVKTALSPRFVPNEIFAVPEIPRTLSGKKQELPIKKLLLGQPLEKVVNKDAMNVVPLAMPPGAGCAPRRPALRPHKTKGWAAVPGC